jgi:hypothetical protein
MGFFSKLFKGVKKVFKKIGKGIKKVATKVGKFMGKIGIVGQIAMSFILPGVGGALLKTLGGTLGKVAAWAGTAGGNALVQGAKAVIGTATKFVTQSARAFNTVTSGVKNFIGEVGKTALNKIPGVNFKGAADNFFMGKDGFFGADTAFGKAAGATAETWNTTIGSAKWMNQFDPTYQRTQAAVSRPMLKTDSIVDDPFADALDPTREAAPSFKVDVPEMPEMPLLEPSAQATITGGDSLLAQKSAGLYEPGFTKGGIEAAQPNLLKDGMDMPSFEEAAADPSKLGTPVRSLDELKAEALDYDFGLEKSTSGINLTGEAVTSGIATAAQEYFSAPEVGYGGASAYGASPVLLGQYEVEEAAPLAQFGFPMVQFDIAQPGDAYYRPLSSWKRAMGVA